MADAQIEVAPLALPRAFVGRSVMTSEKDMFSDAPVLAQRLAEVKEDVPCRVMPVVTAVICDEPGEDGRFICHTTYLDVIDEHPEWISAAALAEAERSRRCGETIRLE